MTVVCNHAGNKTGADTKKMCAIYNIEKSIEKDEMWYVAMPMQCYSLMLCNHVDFNGESGFHFVLFFDGLQFVCSFFVYGFCSIFVWKVILLRFKRTCNGRMHSIQGTFFWLLLLFAVFCLANEKVVLSMFYHKKKFCFSSGECSIHFNFQLLYTYSFSSFLVKLFVSGGRRKRKQTIYSLFYWKPFPVIAVYFLLLPLCK